MTNETVPKDILDKLNAGIEIWATNLDIRDLTSASDSVEVLQDTAADLNAAVVNAAGTGLISLSYGSSDGGTTWYPMAVDTDGHLQADVLGDFLPVPVGTVLSWLKSFTNTPALPDEFVECNGQVLDDGASVYDGQTIPNLNGNNNFLRGAATSGGTGGGATHTHTGTTNSENVHNHPFSFASTTDNAGAHDHSFSDTSSTPSSASNAFNLGADNYAAHYQHTHTVSGTTGSESSHDHDFSDSGTTTSGSAHSHTFTSAAGSSLPPYYNIVWIMRIK